jgi:hypothetical protein
VGNHLEKNNISIELIKEGGDELKNHL